jgi:enoyl-CoA hydratase
MPSPSFENLLIESTRPELVRIVINRPKALNALNQAVLRELETAIDALDPAVRVVVITGAGEKAFIAGADIAEMASFTSMEAERFARQGHALLERFARIDPVVIAEVNGFALGGGCELMLACDFAIASDNAKLGQPEVSLGVTPGFGGTTRLSRRVGLPRAIQVLVSGEQLTADAARAIGLVNEVVPQAELRARVDAIADRIIKNAPVAVKLAKRSAHAGAEADLATANALEAEIFALCFATADQKEGMRAFLEKRKATWGGK